MKVIDAKAADALLVAGGTGATVVRTAVRTLTDARAIHLDDEPLLPNFRAACTIQASRSISHRGRQPPRYKAVSPG
jgi:hypothetical protein